MPSEVKQRRKTPKQSDEESEAAKANSKDEEKEKSPKVKPEPGSTSTSPAVDVRSFMCVLCVAACGALSWMVLQQNQRFSLMEEKYKSLQGKTSSLFNMEEEVLRVSQKCESVQLMLEGLGSQLGALRPQLEALEQDVGRLKEWASGLTEKRAELQISMDALREAVGQIEGRTSSITMDFVNKVASVRTDVRRMDGLHSELEALLAQVGELEDQTTRMENSMVKRIGDVLTSSMERVSSLRAASERNAQAIEQLRKRVPELTAADNEISERLRELESGRARLIRTLTFASDLKPKVANIRRDFGAFEPQLSDLTLRIGRLAEDLTSREQEITELRQTLNNLTAVEGDLSVTTKQLSEIADMSDSVEMHRPT